MSYLGCRILNASDIIAIHDEVKSKSQQMSPDDWVTEGKIKTSVLEIIAEKPNLELFGQPSKYDTPIKKASCLMEGIARLHPFADGNKRTAIYTAFTYLQKENIKLNLKLVKPEFLVFVGSDKSGDEEDIDMMIDLIEFYLKQRIQS